MSYPLRELGQLCSEIASDKILIRNRAIEKLDGILTSARDDLIRLYSSREKPSPSWNNVFNSVVDSITAHSLKVYEAQETKSHQALRNRNHVYSSVVSKILDYSIEAKNNNILKKLVIESFRNLYRNKVVVLNFRKIILRILERGVYDSSDNTKTLSNGDICDILQSLFEFNEPTGNDQKLAVLRMINRTLEISQQRLQVSCDYKDYFKRVRIFAGEAEDEGIRGEVIRMFYLFTRELLVDYHLMVCKRIQQILPRLCSFYTFHLKPDIKRNFFSGIYWALKTIYPNLSKGDCNSVGATLRGDWMGTMHKVMAIIEVEAKERSVQVQKSANCKNDQCYECFVKVAAMVIYVIHWGNCDFSQEGGATRAKISRTTDYLETILESTTKDKTAILPIRLEIFTQLIIMQPHLINLSNYVSVVDAYKRYFLMPNCWQNLRCLRLGISTLLHMESKLFTEIRVESGKWAKIAETVVTDTTNDCDVLREKHLLLQVLIRYNKLSPENCMTFLNFVLVNNSLRRNECIATIREIIRYHENCGLDKTSEIVGKLLNWLYKTSNKIDGRNLLLCIDPLDQELIADTSALMVINFLDPTICSTRPKAEELFQSEEEEDSKQTNYRYCRKYICIEVYGKELREGKPELSEKSTRCLIQSNYDLLMRLLNYEITTISALEDINLDLSRLLKMVFLLRKFFDHNIFEESTYESCSLIKRIRFFIDNIDFQLRSITIPQASKSELLETLELMLEIFTTMCLSKPFLSFLSRSSLNGAIGFIGSVLKFCETIGSEESKQISLVALKILSTLCSSSTHWEIAFPHINDHKITTNFKTTEVLNIIEIFCKQSSNEKIGQYFISMIENICTLHGLNIEISSEIIRMLPDITRYVEKFPDLLNSAIVAASSFLKLCLLKKFPVFFVTKLIDSIRYTARYCPNLIINDDFAITCIDLTRFIKSPNDSIVFATINTITALLDSNWTVVDQSNMEKYFNFCKELYGSIQLEQLPTEGDDVRYNTVGIIVQLLVSLFGFSCFHRAEAFKVLGCYCADLKIDETYFQQFKRVAEYYNCCLNTFTKPYVESFIYAWCEKKQPIIRFPYYLFSGSREHFISSNLSTLCYYQLRLYPAGIEELQRLKYGTKHDLIMSALPMCYAFLVNHLSKSTCQALTGYEADANILFHNLKNAGFNVTSFSNKPHWMTLYSITKLLWDNVYFNEMFGFNIYILTPTLSVNKTNVHEYLRFYLNKCYGCDGNIDECFLRLMKGDPMALLNVLAVFKMESCDYLGFLDKLKSFYCFCSLADIVVHSISHLVPSSSLGNTHSFFLRDILFFLLSVISNPKVDQLILNAGLHFINYILDIPTFKSIIDKYLNNIACILMKISEGTEENIKSLTITIMEQIICQHATEFHDAIKLLGKFPDTFMYQNLRSVQQTISSKATSLRSAVQDFLNAHTKGSIGINSLKQSIAEHKDELESLSDQGGMRSNLLYDLLKRLIDIVRDENELLAMEAARCMGEISSIRMKDVSFYFECDTTFYNMESTYQNEMDFFAESFYVVLDKSLLNYAPASNTALYAVCKDLVNSKIGSRVLGSFPMFTVFLEQGHPNILDNYSSIAPFSFIDIVNEYETMSYEMWVKAFSSRIFKLCQWESFANLCQLSFSFSESSIIPTFKMFLASRQIHLDNIIAMLKHFFLRTFQAIKSEEWKTTRIIYSDKRIIKYFLNICECIRIHNNWIVPINLLHVAEACVYCQAHFMGILYLELWALTEKDKGVARNSDIVRNEVFQSVATQAFKSINCTEAISGFLNPFTSRLEYLSLEGDWSQVLLELDSSNELNKSLYVQNLKRNGLLALSSCDKFSERIDYECCWRLCRWDTPVESDSKSRNLNDLEHEFEKNHFLALKSIFNREEVNCISAIQKAQSAVVLILKEISIECLQNIYKCVTWLHILQQIEDFCQIQFGTSSEPERILEKWNLEQDLKYGNFYCTELVLSHQMTLYKLAGIRAGRKINDFFKERSAVGECILKCINECKKAGNLNLAIRNIALLRNIDTSKQLKAKTLLEDADISWKNGKTKMAKEILRHLMLNNDFVFCLERIQAYRMYGEMLLETNNEAFDVVHKEFFLRSIELLGKYSEHRDKIVSKTGSFDISEFEAYDAESRKLTFATIAKYADKEYTQLNSYLHSETFRTKVQIMEKNKAEAHSLAKQSKDRDKNLGINLMIRNCGIDDKEIKLMETKRSDNLCIAMENYIEFSKLDNTITSPAIFRIIALWFANKRDQKLQNIVKNIIEEIPSYKFICVLNQMSARLSHKSPAFLKVLEEILVKCVVEHPHHTLYKILALVFAYADDPKSSPTHERVSIAKEIINKANNLVNSNCIKQMESMFSALIDFANKDAGKSSSLVLTDKMKKLKNLDNVHCPTIDLPVSINKEYKLTYIRKWEENVDLVGGINAPKKLMCVCSDGVSRPQLLKGKDDLRQDAVMQQVLTMVNELLKSDPETSEQNLLLRTYRIVPLSMRSGILEWCKNTVPLGLYLCGDRKTEGAHKKYRPSDYTVSKCRTISMDALKKQNVDERLKTYLHICEKIKPVFHYFFFEKFLVPGIWFERRLAYTKSVATTSIVGFILGLGDRHVQNILIDELTAEVVHIDFGIAFEQGKIMPTPETVPFRLTRDMVAPMGISGADGVFRKVCERTMKILRKNHIFLTTILEVLLYDPLYVWRWSPQKTLDGNENESNEEKNLTAQRALLRVQDKLEGKEEDKVGTSSIEIQVQRLINEAINVHNLCRLYPGWDPYL